MACGEYCVVKVHVGTRYQAWFDTGTQNNPQLILERPHCDHVGFMVWARIRTEGHTDHLELFPYCPEVSGCDSTIDCSSVCCRFERTNYFCGWLVFGANFLIYHITYNFRILTTLKEKWDKDYQGVSWYLRLSRAC